MNNLIGSIGGAKNRRLVSNSSLSMIQFLNGKNWRTILEFLQMKSKQDGSRLFIPKSKTVSKLEEQSNGHQVKIRFCTGPINQRFLILI